MYESLFQLNGRNAMVFGGAGGIGQALVQGLVEFGANVTIASRNEESLKRAQQEIKEATGKDIAYYVCDASNEEEVKLLSEKYIADNGKVDILLNAQGFNKKNPAVDFPMDAWDQMFTVNVRSLMLTCKYFGKLMKEQGYGKIINLSSVRGVRACGGGNAGYCATKGAVDMLTRTLAVELGPEVTVNAIGPTVTITPMMNMFTPEQMEKMGGNKPLKRIGKAEDCIGTAVFLASSASDFMTGQILYPDGGLTAIG